MNSQSNISQDSLPQVYLPSEADEDSRERRLEAELWEPPFERWLRLADDLLRDWPRNKFRAKKI